MEDQRPLALTRRGLLGAGWRSALVAGVATTGLPLLAEQAEAASNQNRALLCIFLVGGNDSANMIVPLQSESYLNYARIRGSLAIPQQQLLPVEVASGGEVYGFHPALKTMAEQFSVGRVSVVANTGQTTRPNGHAVSSLAYLPDGYLLPSWALSVAGGSTHAQRLSSGLLQLTPDGQSNAKSASDPPQLIKLLASDHTTAAFPQTSLGRQLQQATQLIQQAPHVGLGRQIYIATLSGFDTHTEQATTQQRLFEQLDDAFSCFWNAADSSGFSHRVVTYTDTEVGRTLRPNTHGGTDNGWGAHQLLMGDAIRGGTVLGTFPEMIIGGREDVSGTGVWAPTTSRDEMLLPLASWLGATRCEMKTALPEAGNALNSVVKNREPRLQMQVSLSGVTAHMFSEHVGNEFRFCTEPAAGQVELHRTDLQLTLREVAETRQTGMPEMRRPFSLLFTAECECEFQQGVGVLERTDCGEMENLRHSSDAYGCLCTRNKAGV